MSAILSLALATATLVSAPAPSSPEAVIARWVRGTAQDRARVDVWLDQNDVFNRGDRARVYFRSDRDAYITIIRIDTDGRVRVLLPMDPWEDNWARGGKTFEVLGRDRDEAFRIDDYPGVGYIFAIASADPFNYDDLVRGDHWDYRAISDGRVRGDPYVAVADLAERIAGEGDYDYDVAISPATAGPIRPASTSPWPTPCTPTASSRRMRDAARRSLRRATTAAPALARRPCIPRNG